MVQFSEPSRMSVQASSVGTEAELLGAADSILEIRAEPHRVFSAAWYSVNVLLLLAILGVIYTTAWECSTRRYLKGFSDAVIPETAPPEQKIQSILTWMSSPAAQLTSVYVGELSNRNPIDTLNFQALLRVCGTATNAFLNLADSNGLATRRLLLLDSSLRTKHVDAEVWVNGRWIVVDPAFRTILRGPDGSTLTRDQLAVPSIFAAATKKIPKYDPNYSFERTAHVRMSRLGFIGSPAQELLSFLLPGWEGFTTTSLLMERESLAAMVAALGLVLLFSLTRFGLRWYGEKRLRLHPARIRHRFRRACQAFFTTAN